MGWGIGIAIGWASSAGSAVIGLIWGITSNKNWGETTSEVWG
jgi:hypothetical protein